MNLPFHKLQACGNDFVLIDHRAGVPSGFKFTPETAAKISDRHFGVGCDQILWLKPGEKIEREKSDSAKYSAKILILNADGSEAEMCGNGMRAIGVFLGVRTPGEKKFSLATASGRVDVDLSGKYPEVSLGVPKILSREEKISLPGGVNGIFTRVDMGNPHAVFFLGHGFPENNQTFGKMASIALDRVGRAIENHSLFPARTNVEFVEIESRERVRVRVWERGTGATLACGSGACAVVAAAMDLDLVDASKKIEVILPGGSVFVRMEKTAFLSGPALEVFSGEWRDSF